MDYDDLDFSLNAKEKNEYSVSEISSLIKHKIEKDFANVRIKGEVSGLKIAPSGHVYLSLKDNNAVISAIMWRGVYLSQSIKIQDGQEIICTGNLTTYPGQSKYQMIVNSISLAGVGALMELLAKRKENFLKEGLFDDKHKKNLPKYPQIIGIITSLSGVVIKDILHRVAERFPTKVIVWPVLVQGAKSANEVVEAIEGFNKLLDNKPEIIIIARGGGSIEDLWSFNEEEVVRAAFNSRIPIISAIGHETDFTLLDFVADKRAPTPTGAAEMAVPSSIDILAHISNYKFRTKNIIFSLLKYKYQKYYSYKNLFPDLLYILNIKTQRLDEISIRLLREREFYFEKKYNKIKSLGLKLKNPSNIIEINYNKLFAQKRNLLTAISNLINDFNHQQNLLSSMLKSLSYKNTLNRGFAIIRGEGRIISAKTEFISFSNRSMEVEFKDGKAPLNSK